MKKEKEKKEKKKKLPLGRTVSNNLFALKAIFAASPIYLLVYLGSSFIYGTVEFLSEGYLLRMIVNGIEGGRSVESIVLFVVILATVSLTSFTALSWFWNVISPIEQRKVGAHIEKERPQAYELSSGHDCDPWLHVP